jgi:hypothetical protein
MGILPSSASNTRVCVDPCFTQAQDGAYNSFIHARRRAIGSAAGQECLDNAQEFSRLVDVDIVLDDASIGGIITQVRGGT